MSGAQVLDIYNIALSYLDLSQRVQSLTENTPQAGYCNTFYDRARKIVLEQCYWSFATRAIALTLLIDQQTLEVSALYYPGWRYIYQRPIDCVKAQAVCTYYGLRMNRYMSYWWPGNPWTPLRGEQVRPAWAETLDYTNGATPGQSIDILTDQDSAWLVYTVDPPNVAILPETFIDCVARQLSVLIAGPVSANQKAKEMAIKMAELSLSRALAQNLNEQQPDPYPDSPSIQARL